MLHAADLDGDGDVDFVDFMKLADNFVQSGDVSDGDFDGDGQIGFSDFSALAKNFGFKPIEYLPWS